eukprot:gnl/TRDRNA2_/TRDRNA2_65330_c0_seq1.p1 gnl/TRDRNA2_/TRDRNA2_65330_c0~~gnl/TRDRNA2_/TRDRNA2_65330_c0_seq1.p1  ORF type:complete len:413 (-),score=37.21 gnl/TRDRNA2_/TRDRNA2_65330_c0_seq1:150-1388(-)
MLIPIMSACRAMPDFNCRTLREAQVILCDVVVVPSETRSFNLRAEGAECMQLLFPQNQQEIKVKFSAILDDVLSNRLCQLQEISVPLATDMELCSLRDSLGKQHGALKDLFVRAFTASCVTDCRVADLVREQGSSSELKLQLTWVPKTLFRRNSNRELFQISRHMAKFYISSDHLTLFPELSIMDYVSPIVQWDARPRIEKMETREVIRSLKRHCGTKGTAALEHMLSASTERSDVIDLFLQWINAEGKLLREPMLPATFTLDSPSSVPNEDFYEMKTSSWSQASVVRIEHTYDDYEIDCAIPPSRREYSIPASCAKSFWRYCLEHILGGAEQSVYQLHRGPPGYLPHSWHVTIKQANEDPIYITQQTNWTGTGDEGPEFTTAEHFFRCFERHDADSERQPFFIRTWERDSS